MHRVVITGIGIVSPLGIGKTAFWDGLCSGVSGIGRIKLFDASDFPSQIAGEIQNFNPSEYLPARDLVRTDRFVHHALIAAKEAIEDASLAIDSQPERVGVAIGTGGLGGLGFLSDAYDTLRNKGPRVVSPYVLPGCLPNMAAAWVSMRTGARGPIYSPCTACAAGAQAIGDGYRAIQNGSAEVIIAGGTEAPVHPLVVASFCALRALSLSNDEPCCASRPFDMNRDGFVLAEGAGVLVLEELGAALEREAHIYAEVAGYGISADASHPTAPSTGGPVRAMSLALADGGISRDEVNYVNAHGTSTRLNDVNETNAIKEVFATRAFRLAVSSTKSMTGHLIGAAGAVEAIATALAIQNDLVPPTINYQQYDPECDLDYVPNVARSMPIEVGMSNSFGFGGVNATLVLRKFHIDTEPH